MPLIEASLALRTVHAGAPVAKGREWMTDVK